MLLNLFRLNPKTKVKIYKCLKRLRVVYTNIHILAIIGGQFLDYIRNNQTILMYPKQ
jgi:hypothetical protein